MGVDRFFSFFDRVYSRVIYYGRIKNKDFYDGNKWKNIYIKQSFNCFYLFFIVYLGCKNLNKQLQDGNLIKYEGML